MKRIHEDIASAHDAQEFLRDGMAQLDHLLIGQEEAKLGSLVVIAAGVNGAYVGDPGGGKSTLVKNMHRLVDDIDDEHIAVIPAMADLTAKAVVGGKSEVKKIVGGVEEITSTELNPIINADTKVIRADEINRGAPHGVNAMLEAVEEHKVSNTAGEVVLDGLMWAASTMNPAEARQGVFQIPKAMASRHAVGVVLNGKEENVVSDIISGWTPQPEAIEPITDIYTIQAIQNRIEGTVIPRDMNEIATGRVISANQKLKDSKITDESPNRMASQVSKVARTLGTLNGQEHVTENDIEEALKFVVTSRVGMLGSGNTAQTVEEILR